jgi:prolyl-tRNA synthetase
MLRAGVIAKLGSGLYHMLPMGLRSFRKVENVIREEMNNAGALEFVLPVLIPAEIWETSGRWGVMGKEMFRLKDRHETWNVLGPTHEESFTDLMKGILKSYRDLPVSVYQIHTKFRDEIRPRFGVMRSREFVMKDAYSFHKDQDSLEETYQKMRVAYRNVFSRLGIDTIPVEADTGTMGGSRSEEFMVPSEIGEETLLISHGGKYYSNQEKTPLVPPKKDKEPPARVKAKKKLSTPGLTSIEEVARHVGAEPLHLAKAMVYAVGNEFVIVFIRGDRQINEVKLKNALGGAEYRPASDAELNSMGLVPGFIGPGKIPQGVRVIRDATIRPGRAYIAGANEVDLHESGAEFPASFEERDVALAVEGDPSPAGDGVLRALKGIEVGHIFQLGDKYTKAFNVSVLDETGRPLTPIMGCYGIGVQRTLAAIVEQHHDEKGVVWPVAACPFEVVLVGITRGEEEVKKVEHVYDLLKKGKFDVLYDDRDIRPGVKFADAELVGYPVRVTAGKTFFESGKLEVQVRKTGETVQASPSDLARTVRSLLSRLDREARPKPGRKRKA